MKSESGNDGVQILTESTKIIIPELTGDSLFSVH
jgi:hypothetical protein